MITIHDATLVTPDETIPGGAVQVDGETIVACGPQAAIPHPEAARRIDASGGYLVPGFIDLQLNGGYGMDFSEDPETIWAVGAHLPQFGTTSFLPTIITSPLETVAHAQEVLDEGSPDGYAGATPLGLHLEGPFLNPAKRGAHNPAYLQLPGLDKVTGWTPERGVRLVTLAPELPGALEVVRWLADHGVLVSAGHSLATVEQAQAGFAAGLRYGTHLFNAMPALDHRNPGLIAALLTDPRLTIGIIPDGVHLHPKVVELAWKWAGPGRLNLVTDAMTALGMSAGKYRVGGLEVTVDEQVARLEDGRLAGSLLSLDRALRNLIAFTGCSLQEALATITSVPARLLGMGDRIGGIAPGMRADLVLLAEDLRVAWTMVGGQIIYPY